MKYIPEFELTTENEMESASFEKIEDGEVCKYLLKRSMVVLSNELVVFMQLLVEQHYHLFPKNTI